MKEWKPEVVSDVDVVFPADVLKLMPAMEDIPAQFKNDTPNKWVSWQREWFFHGLKTLPIPKEGIDLETALRYLGFIQSSFTPKHEHKVAAVAYLADCWFSETNLP